MNDAARRRWLQWFFLVSGGPGLIAQLAWTRIFAAGLGHEFPALMGVVSAYFSGLAAGAWWMNRPLRRALRPARWYAVLELFCAVWITATTPFLGDVVETARALIGMEPAWWRETLVALVLPLLVVGPAAAALGATLPALERAIAPLLPDGRAVAGLYSLNTVGAVIGILAAIWVLMPELGFRGTLWLAAAVQAACGVGALAVDRSAASQSGKSRVARGTHKAAHASHDSLSSTRILWTVFGAGLLGIGFELLGTRALAQTTENTIRTFGAALASLLSGMALGAALDRAVSRRGREPSLSTLLGGLAVLLLVEVWVLAYSARVLDELGAWFGAFPAEVVLAMGVFFGPAVLMGAVFAQLAQRIGCEAGGVGRAVAVNAVGAALAGPVWVGLLLPIVGLKWSLVGMAFGYLALVPPPWPGWRMVWPLAALALVVFLPARLQLLELPPGATVTRFQEGRLATVAVVRGADGARTLRVNNHFQQGGTATALAARRQAHVPLLLHPDPRRVLFLGVGTGITLGAAATYPNLEVDGVELVPEILAALPDFEPENGAPQRRAGFRLYPADARRFIRSSKSQYDVVVADLFHPAEDGAGLLYTREHFAAMRERLAEGGIACQWLPLHQLDSQGFRDVAATFLEVFPDATLWLLRFNIDAPVVGLVAGRGWTGPDAILLGRRMASPELAEALRLVALTDPVRLLGYLAGTSSLRGLAAGGTVATDDRPVVLFRAPAEAYGPSTTPHARLLALLDRADPGFENVLPESARASLTPRLNAFRLSRDSHLRGLAKEAEGRRREAIEDYIASAAASADFTAGYAQAVLIASAYANENREWARGILGRLIAVRPDQRLAGELLARLTP